MRATLPKLMHTNKEASIVKELSQHRYEQVCFYFTAVLLSIYMKEVGCLADHACSDTALIL